jgi:hypothetical protein
MCLLPLVAGSDIHYGRNQKKIPDVSCLQSLTEKLPKKSKNTYWCYCFLRLFDHTSIIVPEIISPAIVMIGERGIAEGEGATGCVRLGEGVGVTDTLSDGVEIGKVVVAGRDFSSGGTTVIVVLRTSFIAGLLTLTKYSPGCMSARNP